MPTVELMIVFGALMAIVAVVAIAIDWVGKPLRGRRFIPRIYRFDDEIEPVLAHRPVMVAPAMGPSAMAPGALAPSLAAAPSSAFSASVAEAAPQQATPGGWQPNPTVVSVPAVGAAPSPTTAPSATPPPTTGPEPLTEADIEDWDDLLQSSPDSVISGVDPGATQDWSATSPAWDTSMPLDAVVAGQRPTPIDKAERFWQSAAERATSNRANTHFDNDQIERMSAGRAPNRLNPRTGRHETPELLGLRAASQPSQVQMFWPGDAIDPWSAQ